MSDMLTKSITEAPILISVAGTEKLFGVGSANASILIPTSLLATMVQLNTKVDKITGKGLSTNDFTAIYKAALDSLTENLNAKANTTALTAHTSAVNPHGISKSILGLSNIDNTSDVAKPLSTAVINAFGLKTDLTSFNIHTANHTNPHLVTKALIELSNVDNTSDVNKPLSLAAIAALAGKLNSDAFIIGDALDVETYGIEDGDVLIWNEILEKFVAGYFEFAVLSAVDVDADYILDNGVLTWDELAGNFKALNTLEETFSGETDKIPLSSSLKTMLQALYITDADTCGAAGDALMYRVKDIPLSAISIIEDSDVTLVELEGHDLHPAIGEIAQLTPIWENSGSGYGRGVLNTIAINTTDAVSDTCSGCILPLSIDADISDEDATIYFDVLFSCEKTLGAEETAEIRLYVILNDIANVTHTPIFIAPVYKNVVYEASTGVSTVRKITFEIGISDPTIVNWTSGGAVLTVGSAGVAEFDSNNAIIVGARLRYKTKKIGLRIADVV